MAFEDVSYKFLESELKVCSRGPHGDRGLTQLCLNQCTCTFPRCVPSHIKIKNINCHKTVHVIAGSIGYRMMHSSMYNLVSRVVPQSLSWAAIIRHYQVYTEPDSCVVSCTDMAIKPHLETIFTTVCPVRKLCYVSPPHSIFQLSSDDSYPKDLCLFEMKGNISDSNSVVLNFKFETTVQYYSSADHTVTDVNYHPYLPMPLVANHPDNPFY